MRRRHIGLGGIFAGASASVILMFGLWRGFDPRVSMVFAITLAIGEAFAQLRWRMGVVCKVCGFDPILYLKNPALVVERVKTRLADRRRDPASMLSRPLNLPTITADRVDELKALEERRQKTTGKMLSKSI